MNGTEATSSGATYRILRELGARAQKTHAAIREPNELVVVQKLVRAPASVEREARSLAKNWHPNLARVRHVETIGEELVIATDFIDGVTLAELYAAGAAKRAKPTDPYLPLPVLARIAVDVLGGLQGLHGLRDEANAPLGAFHGAVCPTNVVIGKDGVARIVALHRPRPVRIGSAAESLCYAAPEALEQGSAADPRTDLYGAAAMVFEGVAGKKLYDETQPNRVLQRQREEEITWPETNDPILVAVGRVVLRALAFDPVVRYRSAWELATEIRKACGAQLAAGSAVAQKAVELAGDRIRARRAELEPNAGKKQSIREMPKTPPPAAVAAKTQPMPAAPQPPPAKPTVSSKAPELAKKTAPMPTVSSKATDLPKKPPPPVPKKPEPKVEIAPVSDPAVQAALMSEPQLPYAAKSEPALPAAPKSDPALRVVPKSDPALRTAPKSDPALRTAPKSDPALPAAPKSDPVVEAPPPKVEEPRLDPALVMMSSVIVDEPTAAAPKPHPMLAVTPTPPPAEAALAEPPRRAVVPPPSAMIEPTTDSGVDVPIHDDIPVQAPSPRSGSASLTGFLNKPIPTRRAAAWVAIAAAIAMLITMLVVVVKLRDREPDASRVAATTSEPAPPPATSPTSLVTSMMPVETATPPPPPATAAEPAPTEAPAAETTPAAPATEEPAAAAQPEARGVTPAPAPIAPAPVAPAQTAVPAQPVVPAVPAQPAPTRKTKSYEPLGI